MMRPAFIVPGRPNFLERHFKIFVAVPVVATALCIVAFAIWNLTHRSSSTQTVAANTTQSAIALQPREVTEVADTEAPRQGMSVMEDMKSELVSPAVAQESTATQDSEKTEAPPSPEPAAASVQTSPTPPVQAPSPAKKKTADEDPYIVPKNKPFINRDQFQNGQTADKGKPQQPAPKAAPGTPKPAAKDSNPKNRAVSKTFVLKNGRRIDAVSVADSGNTYVVETPSGGTETFAKADVYLIIKK